MLHRHACAVAVTLVLAPAARAADPSPAPAPAHKSVYGTLSSVDAKRRSVVMKSDDGFLERCFE